MNIVLIGLSHKTAPVAVREQLAFKETLLPEALASLVDQQSVDEGLIVSTCNRVELIASAPAGIEQGLHRLTGFLCDFHRLPARDLHAHLYQHADTAAVKHLFRVASSLDSMVLGESQILGQVKEAYRNAVAAGTIGRVLSQLMHRTISVAKRVRTETGVSQHPVSVSSVAVELAQKIFSELSDKTILLVGAGEVAELAAQSLLEAGSNKILVANRTAERATHLAERFGGGAVSFEALYDILPTADIIIGSTGANDYVIRADQTRRALRSRRKGPLLFIDLSVPRNIDPEVAHLGDTFLFDIDDLSSVIEANLSERQREARAAEVIIEAEVQQFVQQLRALDIGPSVREIKEIIAHLAHAELRRNRKRLGALTAEQEAAIAEVLIPALVNKLSHPIITHLREAARHDREAATLEELRKMVRME